MQSRHPEGQEGQLLAAAVEQTMHTTSPDSSGNHHRGHMGQLHQRRRERLLQALEAGPEEAARRIAGAVAAVSSYYPDHRCHVAYCYSSLAADSQY